MTDSGDVTTLLARAAKGDDQATGKLLPLVYDDLKRRAGAMMRRENSGHTLSATALVHETFIKLIDQTRVEWQGRAHFFGIASQLMRRVLVDHARARGAVKRAGDQVKVEFDEAITMSAGNDMDVLEIDAVIKKLAEVDAQQAEIVVMRFFGGLSMDEVAEALGLSKRAAEGEWTLIKAWLRRELASE